MTCCTELVIHSEGLDFDSKPIKDAVTITYNGAEITISVKGDEYIVEVTTREEQFAKAFGLEGVGTTTWTEILQTTLQRVIFAMTLTANNQLTYMRSMVGDRYVN